MLNEIRDRSGRLVLAAALLAAGGLLSMPANAASEPNIPVTIQNHRFSPSKIHVPAGKPVVLTITNKDKTAEEFDSSDLKVEKVIAGGTHGTVHLRPLGPGQYKFMGEYHSATAHGVVISQ